MIEINLLPGRKKKRRAAPGAAIQAISQRVKDPLLAGVAGVWVVVLAVAGFLYVTQGATRRALEVEVAEARTEAQHFRSVIAERRRQQQLHDLLVSEFDAIRSIDAERHVWPHVMAEVTTALPEYTWLVGLEFVPAPTPPAGADADSTPRRPPPLRFTVNGRTSDIGAYTRFLRQLGSSPWLTQIVPGATSTLVEDERPIIAFVITATFKTADSAFMNVAPLQETTR
jgi:Tfp pilus assembly protein PilN